MEQKNILIVDDEQDLCEILSYNLTAAGFHTDVAYSAEEAAGRIEALQGDCPDRISQSAGPDQRYSLILLDVMMPGMSGFELARLLKSRVATAMIPIIFLTAKDTEDDMLQGFGIGADDYVKKPFSVREVVARVKAVLSRTLPLPAEAGKLVSYEGLHMDFDKKTATADGLPVALTKTEFELLGLLLRHRGQVFSRQQIFDAIWPKDVVVSDRTVDVNITRMRKKIGRYSQHIVSRQGFGYVFEG